MKIITRAVFVIALAVGAAIGSSIPASAAPTPPRPHTAPASSVTCAARGPIIVRACVPRVSPLQRARIVAAPASSSSSLAARFAAGHRTVSASLIGIGGGCLGCKSIPEPAYPNK